MSDAGKSQEPSMEEILASIRRIIAEDEAGRARAGAAPMAPRGSADSHSRTPPRPPARNGVQEPPPMREAPPLRSAPAGDAGDMVLDLTNMVAADGSVVTIAPTFPPVTRSAPPMAQAAPPPLPSAFAPQGNEQQTVAYGGFARRAPPPGPGAEPRTPSFSQPAPQPPAPQGGFGSTDSPSRGVRASAPMPLPPNLSEDSPSRRVFKRRHTAGSAFAELAQSGYTPQAPDPNSNFGKVPAGAVATELDMSPPPVAQPAQFAQPAAFAPPPVPQDPPALPSYVAQDPFVPATFAPPPQVEAPPPAPVAPPAPPALSEEQMRAAVASTAEPIVRSWIDANLATMIEQKLATLVQDRVNESVATSLPQAVDQRIHQNVEANLGPYIEDRVGAHVDARLAAAVEEKVTAAVKQQVAAAVNQQIAEAVSKQVAAAVTQQLQAQQQNVTRVVDERVKSEIRGLFQRLAGN